MKRAAVETNALGFACEHGGFAAAHGKHGELDTR
jgi:hypothetical protein